MFLPPPLRLFHYNFVDLLSTGVISSEQHCKIRTLSHLTLYLKRGYPFLFKPPSCLSRMWTSWSLQVSCDKCLLSDSFLSQTQSPFHSSGHFTDSAGCSSDVKDPAPDDNPNAVSGCSLVWSAQTCGAWKKPFTTFRECPATCGTTTWFMSFCVLVFSTFGSFCWFLRVLVRYHCNSSTLLTLLLFFVTWLPVSGYGLHLVLFWADFSMLKAILLVLVTSLPRRILWWKKGDDFSSFVNLM